jgi:hypothetical protein
MFKQKIFVAIRTLLFNDIGLTPVWVGLLLLLNALFLRLDIAEEDYGVWGIHFLGLDGSYHHHIQLLWHFINSILNN